MCIKNCKSKLIEKYKTIDSNSKQQKRKILDKLKSKGELTVNDHLVHNSNLCIILSCPGEEEFINQKVCFGDTGKNLDIMLENLLKLNINIKGLDSNEKLRYKFSIINASNEVHFREYNGAEAADKDITTDENLTRIKNELMDLKNIQYFILSGDKAGLLYDTIKDSCPEAKISQICHIGNVGIRNTYKNKSTILKNGKSLAKLDESSRDKERLNLIAEQIHKDFSN